MSWTHVLARWPQLITRLCADFPHLELCALERFRGDRTKMEVYLAETHDLTRDEAAETLDHWFTYVGARHCESVAA